MNRPTRSMATALTSRGLPATGTGGYHPHESPLTILVPIGLLAVGAVLAGQLFHGIFVDPERAAEFWRQGIAFSRASRRSAPSMRRCGSSSPRRSSC